jgi:hypothetical protein
LHGDPSRGKIAAMRKLLLAALGVVLVAPAPARGDVLDVYTRLSERDLRPAPLVVTRVPRSLAPLDRTLTTFGTRRGYGLRLEGFSPSATLVLTGGLFRSLTGQLRDLRRNGYRVRPTRLRGQRAYALSRYQERMLLWSERGRVYTLATGTPRAVSAAQLRDTAAGLDPLEGVFSGSAGDPDNPSGAVAVTTARTITARIDWGAECANDIHGRGGHTAVTMLPRRANAFAFDIGADGWTGTVTGTIGASVALDLRAAGTFDGVACDTGPLRIELARD